jgi:hypothetical protein
MNGLKSASDEYNARNYLGHRQGEIAMGEFVQEEVSEGLLHICMYCHRHRNDAGYWEQAGGFSEKFPDERKSHGMCPECLKEHFPGEYVSLCEKGIIESKNK